MSKIVILDRDGVINCDSDQYIKSPEEWHPIPRSIEAIRRLAQNGFTICIATNQSGIARGYYSEDTLTAIHQKMRRLLENTIIHIFYCPHGPNDGCTCRKPNVGLLQDIAKKTAMDTKNTAFVGDSLRDLECAAAFGCRPILVKTGNGCKTLDNLPPHLKNTPVYTDLFEFAQIHT